jgi:hypothetical protein
VVLYGHAGALSALGQGLVATIPLLGEDEAATRWLEEWRAAAEGRDELEAPLRMVEAAAAFKRTRERGHLLALPPEQREIVVGLLS